MCVCVAKPHQFITAARGPTCGSPAACRTAEERALTAGMLWVFIRLKQPAACFVPFLC